MEALRLDTKAIRDRVLNQAVVVKFSDRELDVAVPLVRPIDSYALPHLVTHFCLESGWLCYLDPRDNIDWLIRPGDEAEFSDDGEKWRRLTYMGLSGNTSHTSGRRAMPFLSSSNENVWAYIRPVQTDPEKAKRLERIANMERELAELKKLEA